MVYIKFCLYFSVDGLALVFKILFSRSCSLPHIHHSWLTVILTKQSVIQFLQLKHDFTEKRNIKDVSSHPLSDEHHLTEFSLFYLPLSYYILFIPQDYSFLIIYTVGSIDYDIKLCLVDKNRRNHSRFVFSLISSKQNSFFSHWAQKFYSGGLQ